MKVFMTGPNISDKNKLGGIISFIILYLDFYSGHVDYIPRSPSKRSIFFFLKVINKLKSAFKKTHYDVIHIHSALNLNALIRDSIIVFLVPKRIKKVIHIHGGEYLTNNPNYFTKILIRKFLKGNNVIVLSETEKIIIKKNYRPHKIFVLKNSVRIPFKNNVEEPRLIVNKINNSVNLCYIGRIDKHKGLDYFYKALSKFQNAGYSFRFSLYGNGPECDSYVKKFSEKFSNSFYYGGVVHEKSKTEAFLNSEIFILPSLFEGLPMALLEAMALGRLVIATKVGSIPTLISNNQNGFLVSPANSDELFTAMQKLVAHKNLSIISKNAIKTIDEQYNAELINKSITEIYKNIIN